MTATSTEGLDILEARVRRDAERHAIEAGHVLGEFERVEGRYLLDVAVACDCGAAWQLECPVAEVERLIAMDRAPA